MKRFLLLFLSFLFVCFGLVATASAQDGVDVELICPSSVKVNTALQVQINFYNWDCSNSVQVGRVMKALVGNANDTLGGAGMWGPFNWTFFAPRVLGPATCDVYGTTPTSTTVYTKIIESVPVSLSGKMAMAMVSAVTSTGEMFGGGECMVSVIP